MVAIITGDNMYRYTKLHVSGTINFTLNTQSVEKKIFFFIVQLFVNELT